MFGVPCFRRDVVEFFVMILQPLAGSVRLQVFSSASPWKSLSLNKGGGMKKILVFLLSLFFVSPYAFSDGIISSRISKVTVFADKAQITRRAAVKVKKGLNDISLEVKAFRVDKDSVTAKVFGSGEILSVQLRRIYLEKQPQENINKLRQKIDKLNAERIKAADENNVLSKKQEFLDSIIHFSSVQVPQDLKTSFPEPDMLKNMLDFLDKTYSDINEHKEALSEKIKEIDKEIDKAKRELASLGGARHKEKKAVNILFNSSKNQSINIESSYIVYQASWRPLYKVEASGGSKEINLIMFADITQKTGEDWNNVELNISNAVPLSGMRLPSPRSWFLDIRRFYNEDKVMRKSAFGGNALTGAWKAESVAQSARALNYDSALKEEAHLAVAKARELPVSFEYKLPEAVNIASREKNTLLPVFSRQLKGNFYYYVVPRINPRVFFVCRAEADSELLPGRLNVYFEGTYTGKTFLDSKKAGEEFMINLGAARDIKVKEEKTSDKVKETFFGKLKRQTIIRDLIFKITIENLTDKPKDVHILDSVPVSKTDKIEVKNVKIDPPPAEKNYQDKEGVMLWEVNLAPRDNREIKIQYTLTYPKDTSISGLDL